jgi:hypothetical protein
MSSKELYRFVEGTAVSTYTSSNEAEVYNGETYAPKVMNRSEINDKAQVTKNSVDVSFALQDTYAQHLLNSSVDNVIRLDIFSKDEFSVFRAEFRGRLTKTAPDNTKLKATFESTFTANRRVGSRPIFQRPCRHVQYGPGCKLDIDEWKIAAHVTAMSADGLSITVPETSDGRRYTAGVVILSDGTMRYITSQAGNVLTLIRPSDTLNTQFATAHPVAVYIAPGCTQTEPVCDDEYDNLLNFGGFARIPLTNPMGGNSIV